VLSPKGTAAAVFYEGHLQLFSGLPGAPALTADFPLTGESPIAAVSDDGKVALIAQPDSDSMVLFAFDLEANRRRLSAAAKITGISFFPGSHDAVFTTGSELFRLSESGELGLVASVGKPSGVTLTSDSRRAIVVSSEMNVVSAIDLETGTRATAECSCSPTLVSPLASADIFRVTEGLDGPTWIVDASRTSLRISFVPKVSDRNE
jgi:hypothetical protein